jgi:hypothetical protein
MCDNRQKKEEKLKVEQIIKEVALKEHPESVPSQGFLLVFAVVFFLGFEAVFAFGPGPLLSHCLKEIFMREEPKNLAEWLESKGNPKHSIAEGENGSMVLVVDDNNSLENGITIYSFKEYDFGDYKSFWMSSGWGLRREYIPALKIFLNDDYETNNSSEPEALADTLTFEVWEWRDNEKGECENFIEDIKAVSVCHAKKLLECGITYRKYPKGAWLVYYLGKRKVNKVFEGMNLSNESFNFTLTNTYEEATGLALNGYKEGLDQMMSTGICITHKENAPKNMPSVNVVGHAPHVPNAIAGNPMSMITTRQNEQKAKVITIVYSMTASASTDANKFVVAGKKLLDVITTLETQGYRVGLNVIMAYTSLNEWAIGSVQVKHWRQPSNPLKISYALIHPSFLRRHGFRWLETTPELTNSDFICGHGQALRDRYGSNRKEQEVKLREKGVLKQNQFFVEFYSTYQLSTDEIIKEMGIGG